MHNVRSILTKIEKLEAEDSEKDMICIWLEGTPEDRAKQMEDMEARHPDKKVMGMGWQS